MKPSLFLDRDGVINVRTPGDYIKTPDTFVPEPKMGEAIALLGRHFERIFVVTNQAGVGKELMTEFDLRLVHIRMQEIVEAAGGKIDRVYYCPHRSDAGCFCRKPLTGMAWKALSDFPELSLENAWMVGDSAADIQFGKTLTMRTVLIEGKTEEIDAIAKLKPDFRFDSLWDFANWYAIGV